MRHHISTIALCALTMSTALFADHPPHKFGWKADSPGKPDTPIEKLNAFSATPIAKSSDLRKWMPPIYDQGSLGSCVGNGVASVLDYGHKLTTGKDFFNPSRLFIYYNGREIEGTIIEDSGLQIRDGVKAATLYGAPKESTWPYNIARFKDKPTATAYKEGGSKQVIHSYKLDNTDGTSIRRALSAGYPVVFGAYVYQDIQNLDLFHQTLKMPKPGERSIGGHCMVVVGHDDDKKLYIIRNSWGTLWGKNGNAYFPYAYVESGKICDDFRVVDVTE